MILQMLKQETSNYHQQLESTLHLCDKHLTLARYKGVLANFLGFYQPVELLFSAFQGKHTLNREIERRRKTPWLRQDLYRLGCTQLELDGLPICSNLPALDSLYQMLGCMYVLEGATLGGQIISRHIQRVLHLNEHHGCAFFHGYSSNTGTMWKAFGELLSAYITTREAEAATISAASETFIVFHKWVKVGARV